ncbi:hypothetical protein U7230_07975 [Carboxydochorda subterranea]|uniref:Uncharacterized protein n=1 Tax=Carboxydichorda subterranea TaxID=3109565 RepID=A0ABZ1BT99_9FIRM|nr:hypothetical protein [Limnochorda sp. L945t]WRP16047.1 hypothetical protein U7230_07975 [Limnochorda sp. L945t]
MEYVDVERIVDRKRLRDLVRDFLEASGASYSPEDLESLAHLVYGEIQLFLLDTTRRTVDWFRERHPPSMNR